MVFPWGSFPLSHLDPITADRLVVIAEAGRERAAAVGATTSGFNDLIDGFVDGSLLTSSMINSLRFWVEDTLESLPSFLTGPGYLVYADRAGIYTDPGYADITNFVYQ